MNKVKSELIRLAAEMARCQNMPSPITDDWDLPKTTPKTAFHKIEAAGCLAEDQCKAWAVRLRKIADSIQIKHHCQVVQNLAHLIENQQDMPPEFSRAVDERFWELIQKRCGGETCFEVLTVGERFDRGAAREDMVGQGGGGDVDR